VVETRVFVTLKDYLAADLDLVDRAQPVTGSSKLDSILQAQLRSLPYRTKKNRAGECCSANAARNRLSEYIHSFLLDWERKLPQLVSNKN
jgi:phycoerythrobilin:ferredoxin oxidoreductase